MRHVKSFGLAALLAVSFGGHLQAQDYDEPPPRRGYDGEPGNDRSVRRPPPGRAVGLNCDAVQQGLTGPQPYSCPLPGPRALGARCFCDMPIASFSQPQTAVGRVVR